MYSIDLSKFSSLVCSRPALCAKLVNPSPETVATALLNNRKSLNYLKSEWFTTAALEAFISLTTNYCYDITRILKAFRRDVRGAVSLKSVNVLVKNKPEAILYFPQASLTTWKMALNSGRCYWLKFEAIPEAYRVPEILIEVSAQIEIPEEFWTPALVWDCIRKHPQSIEHIPGNLIIIDHLNHVFQSSDFQMSREDLPETYWDQTVADLAIQASENNLNIIPPKYRTKTLCLIAVKKSCYVISSVPEEVLDTEIMREVLAKTDAVPIMDRFKTLDFMLEIAKHDNDGSTLMTNYLSTYTKPNYNNHIPPVKITEDMWCALLEVQSMYLKFIPKSEQTKAMIDSVLKSATNINGIANVINLNLITKDNAMLFMGTTNPMLQSCIEKKLGGKKKLKPEEQVASSDQVLIDLTDSEYRNL